MRKVRGFRCFFFNDTATTEIYTLSLHDALPISRVVVTSEGRLAPARNHALTGSLLSEQLGRLGNTPYELSEIELDVRGQRSEEHTSELQSRQYLVCRLLLEKKKTTTPSAIDR